MEKVLPSKTAARACVAKLASQKIKFKNYFVVLATKLQFKIRLNFLDVLIDNSGPNLVSSTFRKPTHTGLRTKWNSFVPHRFEMNLINCLLDRCCRICSSYEIIRDGFEQIKTMLSRNGCPKYVLDKRIRKFFLIVSSQLKYYFQKKRFYS